MPPGHEDTKFDYVEGSAVHKVLIFNELILVQLSALVPLWQKNVHFRVNSKVEELNV
jgi:high-affinity K+ transport system ATPase subunit B